MMGAVSTFLHAPDWPALIIDRLQEALFSVDHDWRFTFVNREAATRFGMQPSELLGQVMWDSFPQLNDSVFGAMYRRAMTENTMLTFEEFSPTSQRHFAVAATPLAEGLIVQFRDITPQRTAELALKTQRDHANLQAQVSQALAAVTSDYQATLDQAARQLAEVIGDTCVINLIHQENTRTERVVIYNAHPELLNQLRSEIAKVDQTNLRGTSLERDIRFGEERILLAESAESIKAMLGPAYWPLLDTLSITTMVNVPLRAHERDLGVITLLRHQEHATYTQEDLDLLQDLAHRVALAIMNAYLLDQSQKALAERQQITIALTKSEERYRVLSEATYEGLVIHERGIILDVNQQFADLLGYHRNEVLGRHLSAFISPASRLALQEWLPHRSHAPIEITLLAAHGRELIVEARERDITYRDRSVRLGALRDITIIRETEAALLRSQAQLAQSQKMESVGRVAGGIAHDFNNLLTAILGYTDLLLFETDPQSHLYPDIRAIAKAANRASLLTRQLLAFSRQQVRSPIMLNINQAVEDIEQLLMRVIGEPITLIKKLDPMIGDIIADANQIEQVLMNLVINARDAMPNGGKISIETANVELDETYRTTHHPMIKAGPYVMLAISDTGIGMDQETQDKIFEPFFTTKPVGRGTGLGLSMVYGIVQQSEGSIWVYSEVGVGTTFKIYLPRITDLGSIPPSVRLGTAASAAIETLSEIGNVQPNGYYTVLVAEDDVLVRDLIIRILADAGYQTIEATNGQEALTILLDTAHSVDILLTDIVMPAMGGRELINWVRRSHPTLPIICMSGYTDHTVSVFELLQPCTRFMEKPFTPQILLRNLISALDK